MAFPIFDLAFEGLHNFFSLFFGDLSIRTFEYGGDDFDSLGYVRPTFLIKVAFVAKFLLHVSTNL